MGCLAETGFCRIEGCCVLRRALRKATLAFLQTLDGYTLADLLAPGAQLAASLGLKTRAGACGNEPGRGQPMDDVVIARALHVLAVVIWIGGVAMVTMVVLPALRRGDLGPNRLQAFEAIERRFVWQARIATIIVGLTGFYMTATPGFVGPVPIGASSGGCTRWSCLWLLFTLILFVAEPLILHRRFHARATAAPDAAFALLQRAHWVLLALSLITILGAVAGSQGLSLILSRSAGCGSATRTRRPSYEADGGRQLNRMSIGEDDDMTTEGMRIDRPAEDPVSNVLKWILLAVAVVTFRDSSAGRPSSPTRRRPPSRSLRHRRRHVLMSAADIQAGKAGFQKADLMDYGSLYGMGSYFGEDYTAANLVRLATLTEDEHRQGEGRQGAVGSDRGGASVRSRRRCRSSCRASISPSRSRSFPMPLAAAITTLRGEIAQSLLHHDFAKGWTQAYSLDEQSAAQTADFLIYSSLTTVARRPGTTRPGRRIGPSSRWSATRRPPAPFGGPGSASASRSSPLARCCSSTALSE